MGDLEDALTLLPEDGGCVDGDRAAGRPMRSGGATLLVDDALSTLRPDRPLFWGQSI
ncbi:hypothetical protein [Thiocapsa imhoffii]|uniref:hypothetical protein n=1 Tax=Thiocapsa imhoffii TaxID=382777 RepID=UPI001905886F|nr:hypothetical protein [Thiocapsa imhoffii]